MTRDQLKSISVGRRVQPKNKNLGALEGTIEEIGTEFLKIKWDDISGHVTWESYKQLKLI